MLHAHHVVPLACGGEDRPRNVVVLCPNCHALAHRLGRIVRRTWDGARSPAQLLGELVLCRSTQRWHAYVQGGRSLQHLHNEIRALAATFHTQEVFSGV